MYVEARSHILFVEFSKTDTYSLRKMVVVSCCKYFFFCLSLSLFLSVLKPLSRKWYEIYRALWYVFTFIDNK